MHGNERSHSLTILHQKIIHHLLTILHHLVNHVSLGDRIHRPSGHTWRQLPGEEPSSLQQQSSNESKEPIIDNEKKQYDAATVLAYIPLQQPKWLSSSSKADNAELMNTQRYGKKQKITK